MLASSCALAVASGASTKVASSCRSAWYDRPCRLDVVCWAVGESPTPAAAALTALQAVHGKQTEGGGA